MTIQLYHDELSSASRKIRILIRLLCLKVEEKCVDVSKGEHLLPQFTSVNPFHMVPTLVDGDFILWESWAILIYLVETYAPGCLLYPADLQVRATINRWLYWDACSLNTSLSRLYSPLAEFGRKAAFDDFERFDDKLQDVDRILGTQRYLSGNKMSLADLAICVNVKLIHVFGMEVEKYEHIYRWLARCERDITPPFWKTFIDDPTKSMKDYYTKETDV